MSSGGPTEEDEVWNQLSNLMENNRYGGLPIRLTLIDSGYRPDKPERGPGAPALSQSSRT